MVKDEQEWRREGSGREDEQKKGGRGWGRGRRRDAQVGRRETGHKREAVAVRAYTLTHTLSEGRGGHRRHGAREITSLAELSLPAA